MTIQFLFTVANGAADTNTVSNVGNDSDTLQRMKNRFLLNQRVSKCFNNLLDLGNSYKSYLKLKCTI